MTNQDPYIKFKKQIGYVLVAAAVLYGVLVTILLIFFGSTMSKDQVVWGFINTIISSMMGWLMGQAGTIINNVWGTSRSSDVKGDYIMKESDDAKKLLLSRPSILSAAVLGVDGVLKPGTTTRTDRDTDRPNGDIDRPDLSTVKDPVNQQTGVRHDLQDLSPTGQPGETITRGKVQSNPVG